MINKGGWVPSKGGDNFSKLHENPGIEIEKCKKLIL